MKGMANVKFNEFCDLGFRLQALYFELVAARFSKNVSVKAVPDTMDMPRGDGFAAAGSKPVAYLGVHITLDGAYSGVSPGLLH